MAQNPLDSILNKYGLGQKSSNPLDEILSKHQLDTPEPLVDDRPWYSKIFEPWGPEVKSIPNPQGIDRLQPYLAEGYNRFIRPMSSPGGAAISGIGGPLLNIARRLAPVATGIAATGVGGIGAAKLPGAIGNVAAEGINPETTMDLMEAGGMATALPFGLNMLKGNLGRIGRRIGSKDLPEVLPVEPEILTGPKLLPPVGGESRIIRTPSKVLSGATEITTPPTAEGLKQPKVILNPKTNKFEKLPQREEPYSPFEINQMDIVNRRLSDEALGIVEQLQANPAKKINPAELKTLTSELPKVDMRRNPANEAWNFGRTTMTSYDLSAPLRQGLGLSHRKEYWQSFDDMFKSLGNEDAYRLVEDSIVSDKDFEFWKAMGLKLTDLVDNREEAFLSSYAEKLPGVRASNRAYVAFLNKTRFDTIKGLANEAAGVGIDPKKNEVLARELTGYVNAASGRGNLGSLEKHASALNNVLFSPRLIASRIKFLNPNSYVQIGKGLSPEEASFMRKQYLKSLFDLAGSGRTLVELGRMAGGEVENDPRSSDFGKLKIGNTRLDPYGGFQQYITAASRLATGSTKSSTSGNISEFGEHFGSPTRLSTLGRFAQSKVHPMIGFAMSMLEGKDFTGQPVNVPSQIAQMYIPMLIQDAFELGMDNPTLLPLLIPAGFGMGTQTYGVR